VIISRAMRKFPASERVDSAAWPSNIAAVSVLLAHTRRVDSYDRCTWDPETGALRGLGGPRGFDTYREAAKP
jgi:hypothetical protein